MKIRKLIYNESSRSYTPQWFGKDKILQVDNSDPESVREYYKYKSIVALITIKGEIPTREDFGFEGMFSKKSKELIDLEVQEILRSEVGLTLLQFSSNVKDTSYSCSWEALTPSGITVSMGVTV